MSKGTKLSLSVLKKLLFDTSQSKVSAVANRASAMKCFFENEPTVFLLIS